MIVVKSGFFDEVHHLLPGDTLNFKLTFSDGKEFCIKEDITTSRRVDAYVVYMDSGGVYSARFLDSES